MPMSIMTTVGLQFGGKAHGLPPIFGLPDHLHVGMFLQQGDEAFPDDFMVIGDQNSHRHSAVTVSAKGHSE